jgi:hypothetical protein
VGDVLAVYERPYDPARPVVCLDGTSRRRLADARPPLPPAPGRPARHDPEYVRGGVANVFLVAEPLRGWREVAATRQRTHLDWARCVRRLVGVTYPEAERIVPVVDRPNTHSPASPCAAFPPAEARRIAGRLEIHRTPKHGSRPNVAGIEPAVRRRQCLRQRLPDLAGLGRAVAAWADRRNVAGAAVDRRFTTADARIRPKRPYPAIRP